MLFEKNNNALIGHIDNLQSQINTLSGNVSTISATVGGGALNTTAQTLVGGINELKTNFSEISDYIIETGVNSGWHYRKYNSGILEMWGTRSAEVLVASPEGSLFYGGVSFSWPNYFISAPNNFQSTVMVGGGYGSYYMIGTISTSGCSGWIFGDRKETASKTYYVNIYLEGYWK